MKFTKVFGLAAIAAMLAMAFVGASTASGQAHEIVLCKELVELCPNGQLWPAGTKIITLAENPELLSSLGTTTKCEDSIVSGLSETQFGSLANGLKFDNIAVEFGVLPTPSLGTGCTGSCTSAGGNTIHATFENLRILVEAKDKFFLLGAGLALLKNCPIVGNCTFRNDHVKVLITHTGTHKGHSGANLARITFEGLVLNRVTTHGGSAFCPKEAKWHAKYTIVLAETADGKETGLAWPSLDKP